MKRRRGFTLVELMVVVGITLVLSAIITVVALQAIRRSRVTACASNLSTIGKAMALYAADNNDEIPSYLTVEVTLMSGKVIPEGTATLMSVYSSYGTKQETWKCPLDAFPLPYHLLRPHAAHPELSSYEITPYLWPFAEPSTGRLDLNRIPDPSKQGYFSDVLIEYERLDVRTGHGKLRNTLFFDGHVKEHPTPTIKIAGS